LQNIAPRMPPTAAAPRTAPSSPGLTCRVRTAYSRNSASNIRLKKLTTATPVSDARTIGLAAMNRSPAVRPSSPSAAAGSFGWIMPSCTADPRKDRASTTIAYGPLSAWTRSPPTDGPPRKESARLP
jgi:hypothetical protein